MRSERMKSSTRHDTNAKSNYFCDNILIIYRGSYMSAHVLLNLLKELRRQDKMRGLQSILSLICNKFNKFNNT